MRKKFLYGVLIFSTLFLVGCGGMKTPVVNDIQINNPNETIKEDSSELDALFNDNLSSFISNESKEPINSTENISSEVTETEETITKDDLNTDTSLDLDFEFIGCIHSNINISEENILIDEENNSYVELKFDYEHMKPRIGLVSPSGEVFYYDGTNLIGNNCSFTIDLFNEIVKITISSPEVGEWTYYCDKKDNEEILYSFKSINEEEIYVENSEISIETEKDVKNIEEDF